MRGGGGGYLSEKKLVQVLKKGGRIGRTDEGGFQEERATNVFIRTRGGGKTEKRTGKKAKAFKVG